MKEHYKTYRADQLLNDPSFVAFLRKVDTDNNLYWEQMREEFPALGKEMEIAEEIWNDMKNTECTRQLSPENARKLWKQIESQNNRYDQQKKKKFYLLTLGSGVAAAILFGLFISIWDFQVEDPIVDYHAIRMQPDSISGNKDQITLILSDNRELQFEEPEVNIDYNEEGIIHVRTEKEKTIEQKQSGQAFNQVIVPKGKRTFLILSDGTQVWVNAGTTLIYPVVFTEKKREIYVQGEIFLEVTADKEKPFLVKTSGMDITVLGTRFNVSAYKEDVEQSVVLVEGKVQIATKDRQKNILYPDQKFSLQNEQVHISQVNTDLYTAWIEGYYMFEGEDLKYILEKLAKYYGKEIVYHESIAYTATGKLDLKKDLDDVLLTLKKVSPIAISSRMDTIFIDVNP